MKNKKESQILLENIQSNLNEKINKDNIEINKAIANPNLGKNKDKIKAAGYEPKEDSSGKIYSVRNPKTGKWVMPSDYDNDKKKKVDFKGKLDSERKNQYQTSRHNSDVEKDRIPKSAKVGKHKGFDTYNQEEIQSYSPSFISSPKNSISKNVNDYKDAVKNRDEKARWAQRNREGLSYYEDKVKQAQDDLDREKKYIDKYDKESKDSEEKRKEILARAKSKKNESVLTEGEAIDYEDKLKELYQSYKNDGMEDSFWIDLMNAIDNTEYIDKWYESLDEGCSNELKEYSDKIEESTIYNTKSKEEFEDEESFKSAINDDISTIKDTLEELKNKMNTDDAIETLESHKDIINSELLSKAY